MFCSGICGICSNSGGICCLASDSGSDGNSDYGDPLFPTATITTTTHIPKTTTALHTLRYGTFGNGGNIFDVGGGDGRVLLVFLLLVFLCFCIFVTTSPPPLYVPPTQKAYHHQHH